jgi:osomolarity two-component system sensor histidine kinase TcsA
MENITVLANEIDGDRESGYVFRNLPFACVILDRNFMIVEATNLYIDYTHKSMEEIVGTYFLDHFPENPETTVKVAPVILDVLQRTIDTQTPQFLPTYRYDIFNPTKKSWERRFWKSKCCPILKRQEVIYILHNLEEVTDLVIEKEKFEMKLKEAPTYKSLIDNVKDYAILLMDSRGFIRTWNRGAELIKGYTDEEILGKHFSILYLPEDVKRGEPESNLQEAARTGKIEKEGWRVRKNRDPFWADVIITTLYDDEGNVVGYTKILRDLTEKKRQEEIIQEAKSAKIRSRFLTNMSHELRTPLNSIVAAATILQDMPITQEEKQLVSCVISSGKTIGKLLHDILDYSDLEDQPPQLMMQKFNLLEEVHAVVSSYRFSMKPLVTMTCDIDDLVPIMVVGDRVRFRQVLGNIVDNACKFTERGCINVKVTVDAFLDGTFFLRTTVTDTGIGISEDDRKHLFHPFFQSDLSTTKKYRGAGLGLSISQKLVEAMNGRIGVESSLGLGTTFWFTVQLERDKEKFKNGAFIRKVEYVSAESPGSDQEDVDGCYKYARILVVEDNFINRNLAVKLLRNIGIGEIDTACDGREALLKIVQKTYDLVLMDIQMPVLDGYEATRFIKKIYPNLPVIAMTANAMKNDIADSIKAGMNDHVSKPIDKNFLKTILSKWLNPRTTVFRALSTGSTEDRQTAMGARIDGCDS